MTDQATAAVPEAAPDEDVEYCLAAFCIGPRHHLAPHDGIHYRILDDWKQRNPAHAVCGCHPR